MSIIGGSVAIEDGTKKSEDYAPARKVRVELKFDVPDGESSADFLEYVGRVASNKVQELVYGLTPTAPVAERAKETGAPKENPTIPAPAVTASAPVSGTNPAASDPLGEIPAFLDKKKTKAKKETVTDPLAAAAVTAATTPTASAPTTPEVTHADLYTAASKASDVIGPPAVVAAIKLAAAALPVEQQNIAGLAKLPNEERKAFLVALETLKAFGPAK